MFKKLISLKQKRSYLLVGLVWILLWLIPWGKLPSIQEGNFLAFLTDMLRLGIALLAFMFPGALLYILLKDEDNSRPLVPGIIPIGFMFSVLIIAVIGLAGRITGISFTVVKFTFAFVGLIELFLLAIFKPNYIVNKENLSNSLRSGMKNPPLIFALILSTLITFHDSLFFIDDTTYLAYLTNWQHATQLGFRNIVHEIDAIEFVRFWLAMYPMSQALLSDLSGLPGLLLLGNYLELFLVPLVVITSYWFARVLGVPRKAAGFAVLIQVTLYSWMFGYHFPVGMWFYQSLSEDKVSAAFILAPVFFVFGLDFLQNSRPRIGILFILTGFAITLTHPVILFFSSCIVFSMSLFALVLKKTGWRDVLQLVMIIAISMSPYLIIQISEYRSQIEVPYDAVSASETFQIERYTRIVNEVFYGLNPGVLKFIDFELEDGNVNTALQVFRMTPILVALLAGVISLWHLKDGPLYWYVLSCILLIVFATVPYTGWILGYFVSARMLSRASWFSPLGIGGVIILYSLANWLKTSRVLAWNSLSRSASHYSSTALGLIACFVFTSPMLIYHFVPHIPAYFEVLDHNKQLAQVGAFIDRKSSDSVIAIALDYQDTQLLPGVSSDTRLISFREEKDYNPHNRALTVDEIHERIYASNTIQSLEQTVSTEKRCNSIEKFNVRFVLAVEDNMELFRNLVSNCGNLVEVVYRTDDLVLFEFIEH